MCQDRDMAATTITTTTHNLRFGSVLPFGVVTDIVEGVTNLEGNFVVRVEVTLYTGATEWHTFLEGSPVLIMGAA